MMAGENIKANIICGVLAYFLNQRYFFFSSHWSVQGQKFGMLDIFITTRTINYFLIIA